MAENQLQVRLVTPDRMLIDKAVDAVTLPATNGYLEVLYGAAPLLAELGTGDVQIHGGGADERFYVAWGFAEVLPNCVTILAESAEKPEASDTAAAQRELDQGHKLWNEAGENPDGYARANEIIRDAEARLESAKGQKAAS